MVVVIDISSVEKVCEMFGRLVSVEVSVMDVMVQSVSKFEGIMEFSMFFFYYDMKLWKVLLFVECVKL